MEDELRPYIASHKLTVIRKYIDNELELEELYGDKVPVLTLNDKVLCEYFFDSEILLRAIEKTTVNVK